MRRQEPTRGTLGEPDLWRRLARIRTRGEADKREDRAERERRARAGGERHFERGRVWGARQSDDDTRSASEGSSTAFAPRVMRARGAHGFFP